MAASAASSSTSSLNIRYVLLLNDGLEVRFWFSGGGGSAPNFCILLQLLAAVVLVLALGAEGGEELDEPEVAELDEQEVKGVEEKSVAMGYISFTETSGLVPKAMYLDFRPRHSGLLALKTTTSPTLRPCSDWSRLLTEFLPTGYQLLRISAIFIFSLPKRERMTGICLSSAN